MSKMLMEKIASLKGAAEGAGVGGAVGALLSTVPAAVLLAKGDSHDIKERNKPYAGLQLPDDITPQIYRTLDEAEDNITEGSHPNYYRYPEAKADRVLMKEILNNPDIYGNVTKNQIQKSLMFRRQVENQKQALHSGKPAGLNKYHKMSGKIMAAGTGLGALIGGIAGASK